ncbi:MAG: DUF1571 domain-containing protein [Pirellulales bacterium]
MSSSQAEADQAIHALAKPKRSVKRWVLIGLLMLTALWWARRQYQQRLANSETGYRPPSTDNVTGGSTTGDGAAKANESVVSHPLDPVLVLAESIESKIETEIIDYTAVITKRERIKGKLYDAEVMEARIRSPRPDKESKLAVYLKFIPPSSAAGREVIWVDGSNNGQLLSYQFRVPVKLSPTSMLAMMGNKYPITEIGLLKMVEKLIEKGQRDKELGDCKVEIFQGQLVGGRSCKLIQVTHPEKRDKFDFHIAQIYIDEELGLPIRYAAYLWPNSPGEAPQLEEEYTYSDLKVNVGLTDKDFDPKNPKYNFP